MQIFVKIEFQRFQSSDPLSLKLTDGFTLIQIHGGKLQPWPKYGKCSHSSRQSRRGRWRVPGAMIKTCFVCESARQHTRTQLWWRDTKKRDDSLSIERKIHPDEGGNMNIMRVFFILGTQKNDCGLIKYQKMLRQYISGKYFSKSVKKIFHTIFGCSTTAAYWTNSTNTLQRNQVLYVFIQLNTQRWKAPREKGSK